LSVGFALALLAIFALVVVAVFFTTRRHAATGALSRETRARDKSRPEGNEAATSDSTELEATGRQRSDETFQNLAGDVPATRGDSSVVEWEPIDEEELGVTRRQFLNRGILITSGFAGGALTIGILGFLWPVGGGGFGGVVTAGSLDDILTFIDETNEPFYVPEAKTYLRPYPANALPAAEKVASYRPVLPGMEEGLTALFQRCVHLGCRVPWCITSQWFECPCHGSKYNAVGEKRDGPAPRGLDRFVVTVEGGQVKINTGTVITGPPIGTNTTKQTQEGPSCV
jgi:cytochrome b6-f complex iron-sulfur subunit